MKYFVFIYALVGLVTLTVPPVSVANDVQQVIACKKIGDYSGQIYYFDQGYCPSGYYPV